MSKLSFRARALDPSKPMPIYLAEELPDLPEYSAINRAVPQMPSGMEKEEESEHHLQRAICAGLIIPTPEVFETECEFYERTYPNNYKMPRQMIHMQPLNLEQDIPDYDMDSADESWVNSQTKRLDLSYYKFEQMMDRLEKSSGQTVVTLNEAKALLKQDDEVSIAVYDYWLHKRLKTQHPLILTVKTENRGGIAGNSPYLAFRRRTEKMQTRKNRKNDEASYEKMLKLRRDLSRAVTLLEMIKKREKTKREQLHLTIEVVEKRYQARDFSGQLQAEYLSQVAKSAARPAFAPLYSNQYSHLAQSPQHQWSGVGASGSGGLNQYGGVGVGGGLNKRDLDSLNGGIGSSSSRKEKRQYKKRKHKHTQRDKQRLYSSPGPANESMVSSEEEDLCNVQASESEDEGPYGFKRNKSSAYNLPTQNGFGNWPWTSTDENGGADPRYRFTLTSLAHPRPRCIGFARRRIGRGGRVIIDRMSTDMDDLWSRLDYKIFDSAQPVTRTEADGQEEENNSVVTAIEEPQTQKRLLDINLGISGGGGGRSSSSSLNNVLSSSNNRSRLANNTIHDNNNGRVLAAVNNEDVIKSEATVAAASPVAVASRNYLSKVLGRHSSNVEANTTTMGGGGEGIANQNSNKHWSTSTDERLNPNSSSLTTSSGYLSQHSSAGLKATLSLEATVRGAGGELTRSLSLPMSSATVRAFQDVSASSSLELRRATAAAASGGVATDPPGQQQQLQLPPDWESASVDNEDDMSLAELARKSGPGNGIRSSQTEDELFAMIRKEWLHFRPKTSAEADGQVNSDLVPKISTMAPLDLEVVTLRTEGGERSATSCERDVDLPSSIFLNSEENLFHPQPFSLDDLEWKESPSSSVISSLVASPSNAAVIRAGQGLDQSLSGDSLNELSLNLGDDETGEDNEKVLENILQECQMGDLKILEDPTIFTGLQDTEGEEDEGENGERKPAQLKSLFDRAVGYESEFVSWALEICGSEEERKIKREAATQGVTEKGSSRWRLRRAGRRDLAKRRRKVGKSKFQLSRSTRKDETFSPEKNPAAAVVGDLTSQNCQGLTGSSSGVVIAAAQSATSVDGSVVTIKQEPDALEDGGLQMHEIKIEKQEEMDHEVTTGNTIVVPMASATPTVALHQQQPQQQQQVQRQGQTTTRNIIFPGAGNYLAQQGENTIILTSSLNSVKNHLNGPISEKTLVTTTPNKSGQLPFKRQLAASAGQTKLSEGDLIMTTGLINNGGGNTIGSAGSTNHKFSLTPVGPNAMTKTISIAGQPVSTGNKFYIHSTSLMNAAQQQQQQQQQQITLTGSAGGQPGTKALQYLTPANIKFNLMTTAGSAGAGGVAGQAQDIKSLLASSLSSNIIINDHPGNNIVSGGGASSGQQQQAQHQTVSVQQQGQRPKTMNVFLDGEKRYLYTNNRGQFVAQLNPAKMMNIVPVTAAGGVSSPQMSSCSSVVGGGNLNSNTKIITTTKGVQQAVLDNSNRIISSATAGGGGQGMPTTRGFQTVQRLRAIRNSGQQQQQHISHLTGGGGGGNSGSATGEVRTFNRILIQSAPGAGTGASVSIGGGGDPNGGAGATAAGDGRGGNGASTTTAGGGGGNSATVSSINVNR